MMHDEKAKFIKVMSNVLNDVSSTKANTNLQSALDMKYY
jgi:hypothetical protein